jgi:hypothetical protein
MGMPTKELPGDPPPWSSELVSNQPSLSIADIVSKRSIRGIIMLPHVSIGADVDEDINAPRKIAFPIPKECEAFLYTTSLGCPLGTIYWRDFG